MARYIDADSLLRNTVYNPNHVPYIAESDIIFAPTVDAVEVVRCGECIYYDAPHVEKDGERYEYADMPADAFDKLGTGLVHSGYGVNVGGRCLRSKTRLARGKSIFMDEDDYCSKGERRADDE